MRSVTVMTARVTRLHLARIRRLVGGALRPLAFALTVVIRGDLQTRTAAAGPRDAWSRTSAYRFAHRCGQVWGWLPTRPGPRRPPPCPPERRKGYGRGRPARRPRLRVEPGDRRPVRYLARLGRLGTLRAATGLPAVDPPPGAHRRHGAARRPERVREGRHRADPPPADQRCAGPPPRVHGQPRRRGGRRRGLGRHGGPRPTGGGFQ